LNLPDVEIDPGLGEERFEVEKQVSSTPASKLAGDPGLSTSLRFGRDDNFLGLVFVRLQGFG
jgi:hypothetical protein